jgi:hypothetical protein
MTFRAAVVMVVKNENDLIEPWLFFHGYLFGLDNLYVFDNGSTNAKTLEVLEKYATLGVHVDYSRRTVEDYKSRSLWLGDFFKTLGQEKYDFILPLDCDEFFTVRAVEQIIQCEKDLILDRLETLRGKHAIFQAYHSYPNLIGSTGTFLGWPQKKHFFSQLAFKTTDHGFHNVTGADGAIREDTDFGYIHYHYKPFDIMVAHSKEKLAMDYDVSDLSKVPVDNRLGQFLHMEQSRYRDFVAQFAQHRKYSAPGLEKILAKGGLELPFSEYDLAVC